MQLGKEIRGLSPGACLARQGMDGVGVLKKKKDSVFTATFMAQFRFVSAGFVSCPLPGV